MAAFGRGPEPFMPMFRWLCGRRSLANRSHRVAMILGVLWTALEGFEDSVCYVCVFRVCQDRPVQLAELAHDQHKYVAVRRPRQCPPLLTTQTVQHLYSTCNLHVYHQCGTNAIPSWDLCGQDRCNTSTMRIVLLCFAGVPAVGQHCPPPV